MNSKTKIIQLKALIDQTLRSRINKDYYLLEVPYYDNVGDTLIWQGEVDYLKSFQYKCLGMYSYDSLKLPTFKEDALIIFQGGGNFGDLWTEPHEFRMSIVENNPKNSFLFMPQSVYFTDEKKLKKCADFLKDYNAIICARDNVSYHTLKSNFKNDILLIPDMAFCLNIKKWFKTYPAYKPLLFKRNDKELKEIEYLQFLECQNLDVSDWPTLSNSPTLVKKMRNKCRKYAGNFPFIYDLYCQCVYRPYLIKEGVKFISSHTEIYTTRLHGAILSLLLGKTVRMFDNSYGKNKNFYETWLEDCDNITMIR